MDVIIMEKITSLLPKLRANAAKIPHLTGLTLVPGEVFSWNHSACVITYDSQDEHAVEHLLHEYGHALLNHADYTRDIQLIAMERDAWDEAQKVAAHLDVNIEQDIIESDLDSYRDWLHARSVCPNCNATGIQSGRNRYRCLACLQNWRVNDAKSCQLRRWK